MRRVVILPGLDGTTTLLSGMLRDAPVGLRAEAVALPVEPLGYAALAARMHAMLSLTPDDVLIAESFSGPLAVLLAAHTPVAALVLVNSFVVPPRPRAWRYLTRPALFRLQPPRAVLRHYFLAPDASSEQVSELQRVIRAVPGEVLAQRLASVLDVDVRAELTQSHAPLLDLRGLEDRLVLPQSRAAIIAAAGARVSAVSIHGPHLLLEAAPAKAWQAIMPFLRDHLDGR